MPIDPIPASTLLIAFVASLPWAITAPFYRLRLRGTPSLSDLGASEVAAFTAMHATNTRVSIVLPARNEAVHIADCIRSLRACTWPNVEFIVVNDHSTDDTGALARAAAAGDDRVRVMDAPPLAAGWFGKQWACHVGSAEANGALLLFTDADTRHAPELVSRMLLMRERRGAELLSTGGRQDMETFWERAVQPLMFALILSRYGGTRDIETAKRASDVLANGQCFLLSRAVYDRLGGHACVRQFVAEDLMMAQAVWSAGHRVSLAFGIEQLRTRMYDGFASLVRGWSKNVYAGGRHAMRGGRIGRALYPFLLLSAPLFALLPVLVLLTLSAMALGAAGGSPLVSGVFMSRPIALGLLLWSAVATCGLLVGAAVLNRTNGDPWYRAPYVVPGAVVLLYIFARAIVQGSTVEWKDRAYQSE